MYKIVLFNNTLSGGAGKSIITLAKSLKKAGAEVHLIVFKKNLDYTLPDKVFFHYLKRSDNKPLKSKRDIVSALKKKLVEIGDIDLVVSNSSPSNQLLSKLKLKNTYHCARSAETKRHKGLLKPFKQWWRQRKYRKLYSGKRLITVSKGLEHHILKTIGAKPTSICTIYNPFDFEEIRRMANENLPEIPKEHYIIHVGRFDITSKRHDVLLKAYKKANVEHKLVLLGQGEDREKIETLIDNLSLKEKVLLPDFSRNPYAWIKRADLLVLSSDFEGFGRVLVEALILGTPIVSTDCPTGPREILTGVLSDFLVPTGNANALAEKISQALTQYPKMEDIDLARFRNDIIAKKYIELIENCL